LGDEMNMNAEIKLVGVTFIASRWKEENGKPIGARATNVGLMSFSCDNLPDETKIKLAEIIREAYIEQFQNIAHG